MVLEMSCDVATHHELTKTLTTQGKLKTTYINKSMNERSSRLNIYTDVCRSAVVDAEE